MPPPYFPLFLKNVYFYAYYKVSILCIVSFKRDRERERKAKGWKALAPSPLWALMDKKLRHKFRYLVM